MSGSPELRALEPANSKEPDRILHTPLTTPSRVISSSACQACKRKKSKCSGLPGPCKSCHRSNITCIFDEASDQRRRIARKRKAEESEWHRKVLNDILESVRSSGEQKTQELIQLIRDGASINKLSAFVTETLDNLLQAGLSNTPASDELQEAQDSINVIKNTVSIARTRRKVLSVSQLTDDFVVRVPSKPWTTVTDDDALTSHLISVYLSWFQPASQIVDPEAFLNDAQAGNLNCDFCSPFLMNALLAIGSVYSDNLAVFSDPSDATSRGNAFFAEALRLWEAEEGHISILNLQGLIALIINYNLRGKDKVGWTTLTIVHQMYQDLKLFAAEVGLKDVSNEKDKKLQRARRLTAWMVFNFSTLFTFYTLRPPSIAIPACPRPFSQREVDSAIPWMAYPPLQAPQMVAVARSFEALCDLYQMAWRIQETLIKNEKQISGSRFLQEAEHRSDELNDWYEHLPDALTVHKDVAPAVLDVHLHYLCISTILNGFLKQPDITPPSTPSNIEFASEASKNSINSAREMAHLIEILADKHGFNRMTPISVQACSLGASTLLLDLAEESSRPAFNLFCQALVACNNRWIMTRGVTRMLQATAQQMSITLTHEAATTFREYDERLGSKIKYTDIKSMYPNYVIVQNSTSDVIEMGELLRKWENLEIN